MRRTWGGVKRRLKCQKWRDTIFIKTMTIVTILKIMMTNLVTFWCHSWQLERWRWCLWQGRHKEVKRVGRWSAIVGGGHSHFSQSDCQMGSKVRRFKRYRIFHWLIWRGVCHHIGGLLRCRLEFKILNSAMKIISDDRVVFEIPASRILKYDGWRRVIFPNSCYNHHLILALWNYNSKWWIP